MYSIYKATDIIYYYLKRSEYLEKSTILYLQIQWSGLGSVVLVFHGIVIVYHAYIK